MTPNISTFPGGKPFFTIFLNRLLVYMLYEARTAVFSVVSPIPSEYLAFAGMPKIFIE